MLLIIGLFLYTFIGMLGGNPLHDRYGFRFWRDPGAFASDDAVDRLKGVWRSVTWGTFAIAGPDFISLVAGEVKNPRRVVPRAYRTIIWRVLTFYMGSALCVGINVAHTDPALLGGPNSHGAAKSPVSLQSRASQLMSHGQYVISMNRLSIPVLPDLVNALVLTSVFSTGSSYVFASSRTLYSLGIAGQAPKFVTLTNRRGVPYVAVLIILVASGITYLSVSNGTAKGESCRVEQRAVIYVQYSTGSSTSLPPASSYRGSASLRESLIHSQASPSS